MKVNGAIRGYKRFEGKWYSRGTEFKRAVRKAVIRLLGDRCSRCGNSDWRVLQVDHVNGDGALIRVDGKKLYKEILKGIREKTKRFQCLCANCNWIKRWENEEYLPPSKRVSADLSSGESV